MSSADVVGRADQGCLDFVTCGEENRQSLA
jgi:hypothetical protein